MRRTRIRRPKELFLSHAHADRRFLGRLVAMLRSRGIPYWYSRTHLIGAQQWHDEIGRALARCDWFLVVLSPQATKSEWVKRELVYALNERRYRGKIVPVLLRSCDYNRLSWTLGEFQIVDFRNNFEEACRKLLKTWGQEYYGSEPGARSKLRKTKKHVAENTVPRR
jgi:hypothetical protein